MRTLIRNADVFITNVRYKSLVKLGLGYEELSKDHPELIYAYFSGYGSEGIEAWRPGYDLTCFWARSGALADWTNPGDYPFKPAGAFGDFVVSMSVASGILAAVVGRQNTGRGTRLDVSLYSAAIWYNGVSIVSTQDRYKNEFPKPRLRPHNPLAGTYMGNDGNFLMIIANPFSKYYDKICTILGLDEFVGSEIYGDIKRLKSDPQLMEHFVQCMIEAFSKKSSTEWYALFNENDIPCEYLNHHADVSKDPQAWANGYLQKVTFGNGAEVTMPTPPVKFYNYGTEDYQTACRLGMDTADILEKNGYSKEDIDAMAQSKAIRI